MDGALARTARRALMAVAVGASLVTIAAASGSVATAAAPAGRRHVVRPKPKPKPTPQPKSKCKLVRRRRGKKWVRVKVCPKSPARPTARSAPKAPGSSTAIPVAPGVPTPTPIVTAPTGPGEPAGASAWDEPALVDPTVVTLSDSHRSLTLNQSQDYVVECPPGLLDVSGKITIWGGHNVVFQDCDEYVTNASGDWAGYLEDQTGTLWVHDVHFGGARLTGGIQLQEPGATVVMRDVLFDTVYGSYSTNHAECVQTWSGPARLLIDGLQCSTTYQGLFLLPNQSDSTTRETTWDLRNVQVDGDGAYDLWLGNVQPSQEGSLPLFNVQDVYDCGTGEPRDWDGTTDANQAWAKVKSCPAGGVPHPVWSNPDGTVSGDDDVNSPAAVAGEQP